MIRTVRISETRTETVHMVFPEHTNDRGSLFGGRMMSWIVTAGTLASSRLARGMVVLGSMDALDFFRPVLAGQILHLVAVVPAVGRSSMEVDVEVHVEEPATGRMSLATRASLAFVAVDEAGRPRPVGAQVVADGPEEERLQQQALERRQIRHQRLAQRRQQPEPEEPPPRYHLETCRLVLPEDTIAGNLMFAGRLLMDVDQVASIVAMRYARSLVVTASVDELDFLHPLRTGQVVHYRAALNAVGRTSMEVGVRVLGEDPRSGELYHTCSTFLTFVATDREGRPQPLPPYEPRTEAERRRWEQAQVRRRARLARLGRAW